MKKSLLKKRTMNLYYKVDRTTKPATIALYVLFVLVCLLGLCKILVYDIWMDVSAARNELAAEETRLSGVMQELADYSEVLEKYQRYSATDEEKEIVDRMKVLALLDDAVGSTADMSAVSIGGDTVRIQFSGVTLAQTARIVQKLETSPIVAGTTVSTASTTGEARRADEKNGVSGNGASAPNSAAVQVNILIRLQREVAEK